MEHRRVPLQSFSALWDNRLSTESRDIPLFGIKFCGFRTFLRHRRVSLRNDSVLRDKTILTENRDNAPPPLIHKLFRFRNFLKKSTQGFPYEVFRNCGTKILNRKTCYSLIPLPTPLPLSMKIFDTRKIVKHRRVPIGDFPVLRDKKKFEIQTSHNLVNQKRFRYPKLVKL